VNSGRLRPAPPLLEVRQVGAPFPSLGDDVGPPPPAPPRPSPSATGITLGGGESYSSWIEVLLFLASLVLALYIIAVLAFPRFQEAITYLGRPGPGWVKR
jgi:hypothetical protein